jgi:RND family efflux transporter MFP subunit
MKTNSCVFFLNCAALALVGIPVANAVDFSDADCVIEPHISVDLSTSVDGIVEEVFVDRGDIVKKGDVLVHLEAGVELAAVKQAQFRTQQRAEVELAEGRLLFARRKRERTLKLFSDNAVSELTKDEVELEVETALLDLKNAKENQERALIELERAQEMLKLRRISSPIDGIVVERLVAPGEAIGEQQTVLLKLVQIDPLNVELVVPASQFGLFDLGGTLAVSPRPPGEGTYNAEIVIIDPVIDASSGTFGVRAKLPNPGLSIPAGLVCDVAIADQ